MAGRGVSIMGMSAVFFCFPLASVSCLLYNTYIRKNAKNTQAESIGRKSRRMIPYRSMRAAGKR